MLYKSSEEISKGIYNGQYSTIQRDRIPISNFLLSMSTPIILEAPAAFAPSATYKIRENNLNQDTKK